MWLAFRDMTLFKSVCHTVLIDKKDLGSRESNLEINKTEYYSVQRCLEKEIKFGLRISNEPKKIDRVLIQYLYYCHSIQKKGSIMTHKKCRTIFWKHHIPSKTDQWSTVDTSKRGSSKHSIDDVMNNLVSRFDIESKFRFQKLQFITFKKSKKINMSFLIEIVMIEWIRI